MKTKLISAAILIVNFIVTSAFGQNGNVPYEENVNENIAVFLIDFQDIPANMRAEFPDSSEWERIIFHDKIQKTFSFLSNEKFHIQGDVFNYTTSTDQFWDSLTNTLPLSNQDILNGINIVAPGFDINKYDKSIFLCGHDARLGGSTTGGFSFTVNGQSLYDPNSCFIYFNIGVNLRDTLNYSFESNLLKKRQYLIPINAGTTEEDDTKHGLSDFESTFVHEFIHGLGIQAHANSRTNNGANDYDTPSANNGTYFNEEYGNAYDVMGNMSYSVSLNGSFRNIVGLLSQDEIETIDSPGVQTFTISPINSTANKRGVEVLLPFENNGFGFKDKGYFLEVRDLNWADTLLNHPQLNNNLQGLFVYKVDDLLNLLLDMSPSPNITYAWGDYYDIRDVVLKPGMTYENSDVKFNNVISHPDGSFTVDIEIKNPKITTPAPTLNSAVVQGSNQILLNWTNNHLSSGNTSNITIMYRNFGTQGWNLEATVPNTSTSHLTAFGVGPGDIIEFLIYVGDSPSNLRSKNSNIISNGCNVSIDAIIEHNISCFGANDGMAKVNVIGGVPPYEYKLTGQNYSPSNLIENLTPGFHEITVRDSQGCEFSDTTTFIFEPKAIEVTSIANGNDIEVLANYGTGHFQYSLNGTIWSSNNTFQSVPPGTPVFVKDINDCLYDPILTIEEIEFSQKLIVYPNPAHTILNVDVENASLIEIYSLTGQLVKSKKNSNIINVEDISSGVLIIKIYNDKGIYSSRFIKE